MTSHMTQRSGESFGILLMMMLSMNTVVASATHRTTVTFRGVVPASCEQHQPDRTLTEENSEGHRQRTCLYDQCYSPRKCSIDVRRTSPLGCLSDLQTPPLVLFLLHEFLSQTTLKPMNTQEQIIQRLASLTDQRERLTGEVALIDGVISFWEQQLATLKDEQEV